MASTLNNLNIADWRPQDANRPWYEKALALWPGKIMNAIDLGCGAGEFSQNIKPLVRFLTGVDFSQKYVDRLKKIGLKAVRADLNQPLKLKSSQFDLAVSLEVIEHLINHELFLKEIHRLLKPGGYLIISTPNIAWWGYRLEAVLGRPPKKEGYHLRFFTHHSLIRLLRRSGFKIIKTNSFTTLPFLNRYLPKPIYPKIRFWPNLLAQDLVFLCRKK